MKFDYLIVGCGLSGATIAERIASRLGKKVLVVDKRNHIAGNCYDYYDEYGILVHKYGPHIFHTNSKIVWDYLSNFTDWKIYYHRVKAIIDGKPITIPFGIGSMYEIFPRKLSEKLEKKLLERYKHGLKIPILKLRETDDADLKFLADFIYENVFYGYTVKQWALTPEELDFSVTSRIPVLVGRDDRYFQDKYQGIPALGYTEMVRKMLDRKNIKLMLQTSFEEIAGEVVYDRLIYTGPIDSFFDYKFGKLPYRSLRFDFRSLDRERFQEVAQVNYPNNFDYTRITEFKHFLEQKSDSTTIAYEFSEEFAEGKNDPYYPIPRKENSSLFAKYRAEADKIKDDVIFVGRLADYKYYNMDQTVGVALQVFEKEFAGKK